MRPVRLAWWLVDTFNFEISAPKMRNVVIGSLLVLSTTTTFAEYRETWVSPGELKSLEAGRKSPPSKARSVKRLTPQASSPRSHAQPDRAARQSTSDPIAAFDRDDRGVLDQQKSRSASTKPRQEKTVRQKT